MHRVHKRKRKKDGKTVLSQDYSLTYRYGEMVVEKTIPLKTPNKEVAEKLARDFRDNWEREQAGLLPPQKLVNGASVPLSEHLAAFIADLEKRGKTPKNNKQTRKDVLRLINECGWNRIGDVSPSSFIDWRSGIDGLAPRTLNSYLESACAFFNWLCKSELIEYNPLRNVAKVEEAGKETRKRRALSNDGYYGLVEVAPEYRKVAYLIAGRSGLRFGEIQQLQWGDVHLDEDLPYILARAATTKNRKEARIPITKELAQVLAEYKPENAKQSDPVCRKGVPRTRTMKKDLAKAGIPYVDEMGRYAGFHSFRYTYCTYLKSQGLNPGEVKILMRHSDQKLTDNIYTDVNILPINEKVSNLPAEEALTEILTGSTGKSSQNGSVPVAKDSAQQCSGSVGGEGDCRGVSPPGSVLKWSGRLDSNQRPLRPERSALPG